MNYSIDSLIKQISIRHACKNIGTYVRDLERSLDIKVNLGRCKYEYVYKAEFEFCIDARNMKKRILEFERCQTMFSVEECARSFSDLRATFKFHPENAI